MNRSTTTAFILAAALAGTWAGMASAITPETPPETCTRCDTPVTPLPGPTLPNPPEPEPPRATPSDRDPTAPYVRQYWTGQCRYLDDGRIITHTAFGFESFAYRQERAHAQCRARLAANPVVWPHEERW
jgi:hypothetical protein